MYDDQTQYSIDYLNQIAPQPQRRPGGQKWLIIGLILGVLAVVVIALTAFANMSGGPSRDLERLSARLTSLQTITDAAQPNITHGELRSSNSNLSIFLSNTNRDIVEPLENNGINPKKLDKALIESESYTDMVSTLEDARLNGVYDSVYVREMGLRLAELNALMGRIHSTTRSQSMKEFLVTSDTSLEAIRTQLKTIGESSTLQ